MPRIVSLLPSATEIVCALGFEEALVGRSHECDFPRGIERLPVCTEAKVRGSDTRAIHSSVSAILQQDISVYRVDAEVLRELQPTHIVTQIQCEVCAVSLRDVEAAMANWIGTAPQLIALNPQSLNDVFDDIRRTATALGADGDSLVGSMRSKMDAIASSAPTTRKPRMVIIEWIEPLMAAGNWMPALVAMAGAIDPLGSAGQHSAWITWDDLVRADPDIIVIAPCGFRIEDSQRDLHLLTEDERWQSLRAVRAERVFIADGNQFFNRPGPRLVESLQILAEIVQQCAV
jgi:iron complex transport system substrate-binding protein